MLFGATEGTKVYSPWFPRQGDNAIMTLEVVAVSGATIKVEVLTKNSEDAGDGTIVTGVTGDADITASTVGRSDGEWDQVLEELVRYKFTVTNTTEKWVLFRMLPPVWFDTVDAA